MTHSQLVHNLRKSGHDIQGRLTANDCDVLHMLIGLMGELGELADNLKRACIYNQLPDLENLKEEFGDIEFYLEGLYQATGIDRAECKALNIAKLTKRYPTGSYSNADAAVRADKTPLK